MQVILQTGYASEQTPRELLHRLNIQGYYDKTEGPEQLLLWTTVGLKAAYTIQLLFKSRHGYRVLAREHPRVAPHPAHVRAHERGAAAGCHLAQHRRGERERRLLLGDNRRLGGTHHLAATPPFAAHEQASEVILPQTIAAIHRALQEARIQIGPLGTILPLRVGPLTVGVIYIDKAVVGDQTLELLRLLGNQAAAAIHNAQLCELATVDVLTGVYVRAFFEQALIRELAASFRARQGLAR